MKCGTLLIPTIEADQGLGANKEYLSVKFEVDNTKFDQFILEFKARGQSTLNLNPDWENVMFVGAQNSMFSFYDFKIKSEKEVKDCDSKNEYKSFECIQKYLASKVKCRFPWLKKYYNSQKSLKSCNTTEESKDLVETIFNILQRERDIELKEFGCLKTNCMETTWRPEFWFQANDELSENSYFEVNNGTTTLFFNQISNKASIQLYKYLST